MSNWIGRWLADRWVMGVALLVLGYLSLPILVVAGLSFNRPSSRLSYDFNEFTLDNWRQPVRHRRHVRRGGPQHADRPHRHGRRHGRSAR